jgi:hypothetical protein
VPLRTGTGASKETICKTDQKCTAVVVLTQTLTVDCAANRFVPMIDKVDCRFSNGECDENSVMALKTWRSNAPKVFRHIAIAVLGRVVDPCAGTKGHEGVPQRLRNITAALMSQATTAGD